MQKHAKKSFFIGLLALIILNSSLLLIFVPLGDQEQNDNKDQNNTPLPSMTLAWNRFHITSDWNSGEDVAIDSQDNIYALGTVYTSANDDQIFIMKYNSSGGSVWNVTWGGTNIDKASAIALDPSTDDIYVTGRFLNTSNDVFLVKFNSSGIHQWNKTWGGANYEWGHDIALDPEGKILIAGETEDGPAGLNDMVCLKYNNSGFLEWNKTWGTARRDYAYGIATDSANNVYLAGNSPYYDGFNDYYNATLVKLDSDGNYQWHEKWGAIYPGGSDFTCANDVNIDNNDNIYVTGEITDDLLGAQPETFLLKYNTSGDLKWDDINQTMNGDWGNQISFDSYGNIYVAGKSDYGFLLFKYQPNGTQMWGKFINHPTYFYTWGYHYYDANGVVLDSQDILYICGSFEPGDTNPYGIALERYHVYPEPFTFSSTAGDPDNDGEFDLNWGSPIEADNFSIYRHTSPITEINNSLHVSASYVEGSSHHLSGLSNGTYYYKVVAFNSEGNRTSSNYVEILVNVSGSFDGGNGDSPNDSSNDSQEEDSDNSIDNPEDLILFLILLFIIGSAIVVAASTYHFRKDKLSKKREDHYGTTWDRSLNKRLLGEISDQKELLLIFRQYDTLNEILRRLKAYRLTALTPQFLEKVNRFDWTETEKKEFLREMLNFTPKERNEIINDMLKKCHLV